MARTVRLGIIGVGNMGYNHCKSIQEINHIDLVACCDAEPERTRRVSEKFGAEPFEDHRSLIRSGTCDAVLIATPHYDHTTAGIAALKAGLHVLVEKPISVHKRDAERLISAHRKSDQIFAAMFNQRTDPAYKRIRKLINDGTLGQVRRFQWTITDWFRSQAYYDSGGWRATWAGEGGGVLLNQCPHQLDLLQWMFGMPDRVHANCHFGRHHEIEVEDEVTAYLDYTDGKTGVFITSTGEAPGSNRLEIAAENARLVYDASAGEIEILRNASPVSAAIAENRPFEKPKIRSQTIRLDHTGGQHPEILRNFAAAILRGQPLIAPAAEGIHSVELANSMLLSSWLAKTVNLPISSARYANQLKKRIATSSFKKNVQETVIEDLSSSF
jgi:predicted dehydrogenase